MIENLFLSVGAIKAGTTWLYIQLRNHPDIYITPEKEIHYFASITGKANLLSHENRIQKLFKYVNGKDFNNFKQNINEITWYANYAQPTHINDAWYQSLFKDTKKKYCADFCNLNSNLDEAGWLRVRQNFTHKIKAVYCLRDPFKRAWSHYKFHMEWIGRGDEILSVGFQEFKRKMNTDLFTSLARDDLAIERLEKNLINGEFKILYFEDFRTKPQETLDQLCSFLSISNVKSSKEEFDDIINPSQNIQMPAEWQAFLWDYLDPVYDALDKKGLSHPDWIRRN